MKQTLPTVLTGVQAEPQTISAWCLPVLLIPGDLNTYLLCCHACALNTNCTNKASWKGSSRWEQRHFSALKELAQVSQGWLQAWSNHLCGRNISRKVKQTYWGPVKGGAEQILPPGSMREEAVSPSHGQACGWLHWELGGEGQTAPVLPNSFCLNEGR